MPGWQPEDQVMTIDRQHLATMLYKARRRLPTSMAELRNLNESETNPWPTITRHVLSINRDTVYRSPGPTLICTDADQLPGRRFDGHCGLTAV